MNNHLHTGPATALLLPSPQTDFSVKSELETVSISANISGESLPVSGKNIISFVVPVYRNKQTVSVTCETIASLFKSHIRDLDYEIVFVDDGSDDGSLEELLRLHNENAHVKVIELTKNFGQVPAILAGLKEAKGDAVINVSADLQDPINLVQEMLEQWLAGSQIVICYRTDRKDGILTRLFSSMAWALIRSTVPQMPRGGFDFFLLDREALNAFNEIHARNRFMQGDVLSLGYRTNLIPYTRQERKFGKSQWTFEKKLKYFIDAIIDSSYIPIRLMSAVGILTLLSGFCYAFIIVVAWSQHRVPFNGWAPIVIVMLIIGGLIMFMLGVIGEYIWRIFDEVKGKPRYLVRRRYIQ